MRKTLVSLLLLVMVMGTFGCAIKPGHLMKLMSNKELVIITIVNIIMSEEIIIVITITIMIITMANLKPNVKWLLSGSLRMVYGLRKKKKDVLQLRLLIGMNKLY